MVTVEELDKRVRKLETHGAKQTKSKLDKNKEEFTITPEQSSASYTFASSGNTEIVTVEKLNKDRTKALISFESVKGKRVRRIVKYAKLNFDGDSGGTPPEELEEGSTVINPIDPSEENNPFLIAG